MSDQRGEILVLEARIRELQAALREAAGAWEDRLDDLRIHTGRPRPEELARIQEMLRLAGD